MKKRRKPLDWDPDIEERSHEDNLFEDSAFILGTRSAANALAATSIFGMLQNDIDAESSYAQRCPKCERHMLVRVRPGDPKSPWRCNHCGNDSDEFGNKL